MIGGSGDSSRFDARRGMRWARSACKARGVLCWIRRSMTVERNETDVKHRRGCLTCSICFLGVIEFDSSSLESQNSILDESIFAWYYPGLLCRFQEPLLLPSCIVWVDLQFDGHSDWSNHVLHLCPTGALANRFLPQWVRHGISILRKSASVFLVVVTPFHIDKNDARFFPLHVAWVFISSRP